MSDRAYDDRLITDYLLGALAPDEAERLDELSVADPEFAARLETLEDDLVDGYVRNELEGVTLHRFRSFYLASTRRRERVEFARAFQGVVDRGASIGVVAERGPAAIPLRVQPGPAKRRGGWRWALAAAAVLLIGAVSWLGVENERLRRANESAIATSRNAERRLQELQKEMAEQEAVRRAQRGAGQTAPEKAPPVIVAFTLAAPVRGALTMPALVVPGEADYVTVQLELESDGYGAYSAQLKSPGRPQAVWTSRRLKALGKAGARFVSVSFERGVLQPQTYMLELSGLSGSPEPVATYAFRVARP